MWYCWSGKKLICLDKFEKKNHPFPSLNKVDPVQQLITIYDLVIMAVWYYCTLVTVMKRIRTLNEMVPLYQENLLYWLFQPGVNFTRNTLRHKKNDFRQLTWGTGRVRLGGKAEDAKGLNCENWLLTSSKKIIRNVTEFVRQRIKKKNLNLPRV